VGEANCAVCDSLQLVQDRQVLSGTLSVAEFSRLSESLHDNSGSLNYRVEGTVDRRDRPLLKLQVGGAVRLQCQRCLDGFEHNVAIASTVRLVAPEVLDREYDDDPDEPDCVAASKTFDLAALIEDEVLLALPVYPRHEESRCKVRVASAGTMALAAKVEAFSALQALKQKVIQSKE
jgi:uncharacterized protein